MQFILFLFFFFLQESLFSGHVMLGGGGGFINYMKQMQKTLMLILFDETSLT